MCIFALELQNGNRIMLRLKEILKEKGMTGVQLAALNKNEKGEPVTPQYINGIARGRGSISFKKLKEIADALGVTMAELFDDYRERDASIVFCPNCNERLRLVKDNDASIKAVSEK